MFIEIIEPVHIKWLGPVLIAGVVGATCSIMPEPRTIITEVKFWYDDREPMTAKPELWETFEPQLIQVLDSFADIEKQFKYEVI